MQHFTTTCLRSSIVMALLLIVNSILPAVAVADDATEPPVIVLDTYGVWRFHQTLRPPMVDTEEGLQSELVGVTALNQPTPPPADGWTKPDFDDSRWIQGRPISAAWSPYLAELCLRGKFAIDDPAKASPMRLSIAYHGGVIVYLNGTEIARGHMGPPKPDAEPLGEGYAVEAFASADGKLLTSELYDRAPAAVRQATLAARRRQLSDVTLPENLLRKGLNVLAVHIVRAPYHKVVADQPVAAGRGATRRELAWNTCQLFRLQLLADRAEGLVSAATRPEGFAVWNRNLLAGDFDLDYGDPLEPLRPIALSGARNGSYNARLLVGSTRPILGLKATASDLRSVGGASIPASAVRVRYGLPWGSQYACLPYGKSPNPYPADVEFLGALVESAPQEYPLIEKKNAPHAADAPPILPGATATIWVTVDVPRTVDPGSYSGTLRIEAQGEEPVLANVKLDVLPWTLPDTAHWRTWVELIQSPDTLAMEYELPLWSDRHWQMIARSLELIGATSSRVLYVPLIAQTNNGNAESMVRWIRKSNGTFDYDFSIMDRYLDLAEKHMGKPRIVAFEVWELYLVDKKRHAGAAGQQAAAIQYLEGRNALAESGPLVTVVDPQTGKTENIVLPHFDEEASRPLWEPLFTALRQRLEKRGLTDAMMIGTMSDVVPTRGELDFFKQVTGNLPWVSHAHHPAPSHLAPIGYQTRVWNIHFSDYDPIEKRSYGWKGDLLMADYERHGSINQLSFTYWRHLGEFNITGGQRGIGRIGADFWSVIRDRNNRRAGTVAARYPQSSRRNLDILASILAPGPDGPVTTPNYEIFREGIQECEARIFIETALTDEALREKLGQQLADRCQAALDERLLAMWRGLSSQQLSGPGWHYLVWRGWPNVAGQPWFMGSLWEDRTRTLFQLAGEVEAKLR